MCALATQAFIVVCIRDEPRLSLIRKNHLTNVMFDNVDGIRKLLNQIDRG